MARHDDPSACEHPNEAPHVCPCPPGCYCATRTCRVVAGPRAVAEMAAKAAGLREQVAELEIRASRAVEYLGDLGRDHAGRPLPVDEAALVARTANDHDRATMRDTKRAADERESSLRAEVERLRGALGVIAEQASDRDDAENVLRAWREAARARDTADAQRDDWKRQAYASAALHSESNERAEALSTLLHQVAQALGVPIETPLGDPERGVLARAKALAGGTSKAPERDEIDALAGRMAAGGAAVHVRHDRRLYSVVTRADVARVLAALPAGEVAP